MHRVFEDKVTMEGPTFTHNSLQMNLLSDLIEFMTFMLKTSKKCG